MTLNPNQFTDKAGRTWTLEIVAGDLKRLRANGLDLNVPMRERVDRLLEALTDNARLVEIGHMLCDPVEPPVTLDDFADQLGGDELEAMAKAIYGAFVLFSPSPFRPTLWAWMSDESDTDQGATSASKSGASDSVGSSASIPAG